MYKFPLRFWLALHPDIQRPIGGVKQIHRLSEVLSSLGYHSTIIQDDSSFKPSWFESNVDTISLRRFNESISLSKARDVVVLPETFINSFSSYAKGIPKIIFNQNGAYTFSSKKLTPSSIIELYHHPDLLYVLCVSSRDQKFLSKCLLVGESKVSRLFNDIDSSVFKFGTRKRRQIAFMPRKNSQDSKIVIALLRCQPWWKGWKVVPIENKSQTEVSTILQDSIAFLSFGHPEGFGLPLAEALSCGCALVGYSGLGGREIFDVGECHGVSLEVAFGDWHGFVDGVKALNQSLLKRPYELFESLRLCSAEVRQIYSHDVFVTSVSSAINKIHAAHNEKYSSSSSV